MKRLLAIGAATVSLIVPLDYGKVIYQNDFSMRMSAEAVPYSGWREVTYSTGKLAGDNYLDPFNGSVRDNWVRVKAVPTTSASTIALVVLCLSLSNSIPA